MKNVIDLQIRNTALVVNPLNANQFTYQTGKFTVTVLHHLVSKIENAIAKKDIILCSFLDISGAFDNTTYLSIQTAAIAKGIDTPTIKWINSMLSGRTISTTLGQTSITVYAVKGCPQGGSNSMTWLSITIQLKS